ncbi:hypothetical protein PVAP13_9NG268292 [Panicum virgatum]|uniref:Uncharacterized protein n=1 Tax=Panicum virgatum TaxID=38727 RepID=A0A8T0MNL2_PANVG|nr:hypothetical protein PVAP13_9NG268292 [Panicum virgatum]
MDNMTCAEDSTRVWGFHTWSVQSDPQSPRKANRARIPAPPVEKRRSPTAPSRQPTTIPRAPQEEDEQPKQQRTNQTTDYSPPPASEEANQSPGGSPPRRTGRAAGGEFGGAGPGRERTAGGVVVAGNGHGLILAGRRVKRTVACR